MDVITRAEATLPENLAGAPTAVYTEIVGIISTAGCADPAFLRIRDTLRAWFPAESA